MKDKHNGRANTISFPLFSVWFSLANVLAPSEMDISDSFLNDDDDDDFTYRSSDDVS